MKGYQYKNKRKYLKKEQLYSFILQALEPRIVFLRHENKLEKLKKVSQWINNVQVIDNTHDAIK